MNHQDLNKSYYNGIREGITQYAWWKDGVQYVGTCGETLAQALANIDAEEARALEILKFHGGYDETKPYDVLLEKRP